MTGFEAGEATWVAKLGNLRNVIRQEVIARQVSTHLGDRRSVLDVGCGQGTQALRLLGAGCSVVGVDPSDALLDQFRRDAEALGFAPDLRPGRVGDLDGILGAEQFDLVCAHGLLMYLDEPGGAVQALAARVAPSGLLSFTVKNAHGLAMRPALRKDFPGALDAFERDTYMNELGVQAQAHRLADVESWLGACGLSLQTWYGVRVFNDAVAGDVMPPTDGTLADLLESESVAGRTDPYRWLGSQLHIIAAR